MLRSPTRNSAEMTRELLLLAAPMIGVTLSRLLMGFIDFVMVSKLGTAAQAAISPCTLLLYVIACAGMGVGQAVQTFVSQAEGRGQPERAGAYIWPTLLLALIGTIVSAPVAWFVGDWFPVLIGRYGHHPPDVQEMEIAFLRYGLWAVGPMIACAGLECFWNGLKRPMVDFVAIANSLATLLAWSVRLVILVIPLFSAAIEQRYHVFSSLGLRLRELTQLLRTGAPIGMQWLVDVGAWFVFLQYLMPPLGEPAMAAANVVIQLMHLSFMPCLGIGMALTTQVGNAVGARDAALAVRRVQIARRIVLAYMGVMALLFIFGGEPLVSLLSWEKNDALRDDVLRLATQMAVWAGLFQVFDGLCIIYSFAARGAGDTRAPALLFAACCWGIFVLGGFALSRLWPNLGIHALWSMATLYIVVLGVLLWWRFHSRESELATPLPT